MSCPAERLQALFQRLYDHFGPQGWWPGDTPFEVLVGAVLTQNTSWTNVEKAIANLQGAGLLDFAALLTATPDRLAECIRPAGYYRVKAERLQGLVRAIQDEYGDLDALFALPQAPLRDWLLAVKGVGPETADSILLYAAGQPAFVVDAYTCRILVRHNFLDPEQGLAYDEVQALFLDNLPADTTLFGEFHALIVRLGKEFCKKTRPRCESCPLNGL